MRKEGGGHHKNGDVACGGKPVGVFMELLGLSGCGGDVLRFRMNETALSRANVFKGCYLKPRKQRRALTGFKVSASLQNQRHGQSPRENCISIHQNANAKRYICPGAAV